MCNDIITIFKKELLELKGSGRRLLYLIVLIIVPILFSISDAHTTIPINIVVFAIPIILSIGVAGQLTSDAIISEKRYKTLDILLASNISKASIIIGKVVPASILSYFFGILSMLIIKIGFIYTKKSYQFEIPWYVFLIMIFITYFISCLTITISILITDEKVIPMIGTFSSIGIIGGIGYILYKLNITFNISGIVIVLLLSLLFSIIITIVASELLKRVVVITKI